MNLTLFVRRVLLISPFVFAAILVGAGSALLGICGPFTDVSDAAFCPFVLEIFTLGITTGTSPTTYSPADAVSRLQMAAFLSRTVDGVLRRGSRRASLDQFWTPQSSGVLGAATVGASPVATACDGADVWVTHFNGGTVSRVRASDGKLLETWTGAPGAYSALSAMGAVVVAAATSPGVLYRIDPRQAAGAMATVATNLGVFPIDTAFDGARVWVSSVGPPGSVSIVTPGAVPWTVTTVTTGFNSLAGILYDGANIWTVDNGADRLRKLDSAGAILQTVTVGDGPQIPVFDGANIWVPNFSSNSISVVRASNGAVLATLTGNGLNLPTYAAFDGQRVLVTGVNQLSLWKAADLSPISFLTSSEVPYGSCSEGVNFWVAMNGSNHLARF